MKDLWQELRPLLGCLAAFSLFINVLFLAPAVFTLQVFDRVIPSNSQETLQVLLLGTALALLIVLFLEYVRSRLQNILSNIVEEHLSPPVVKAIVAKAAHAPHKAGTEGIRDVSTLRNLFSAAGLNALMDAPWAPVYVLVIWAFHPALGIGAALSVGLMLILAWLNDRITRRGLEDLHSEGLRASRYVESSLRNAEVLQALGMTDRLLERWRKLQDKAATTQFSTSRSSSGFMAITRFSRQAIQIVMLSLGAYLVLNQLASPGIMIATTVLLGRAIQPVEQLVSSWRVLTDSRAAYRRLAELSRDFDKQERQATLPLPSGRIAVEGVSFRAAGSDKPILLNIAFGLSTGEALAIIGPSAAGKSTMARLLTGVWPPTAGTIRLDGVDLVHWPRQELGPWIGYVPQDVELFDGTVAQNIARLGEVNSESVMAAAKRANVHEMILCLPEGYETQVGEQGLRLSPGQRQRVALARALYGDPKLVVLDEPNSSLDGDGEVALARALSGLRNEGVTSIVVTHRPSLIAHVDKILVLEAGRVKQFGPTGEVMKAMQLQALAVVGEKAA